MLGAGWGRGDRQQGCREKSETNGGVVGAKGWQRARRALGSALWGGASGRLGLGRTLGVGGQDFGYLLGPLPAWAEVAPRSKRRCVLERKQPYSGDEWCSGPDSEEDDKPIGATHSECPSLSGCCGLWCPRGIAALRELPSPHLGPQRAKPGQEPDKRQEPRLFLSHLISLT